MYNQPEAHALKLLDLPLMLRLKQNAIVLHSELGLTEDARGQNSALLSSIVFPRGLHTLVAHVYDKDVVGQFRHRPGETNAHIVYLAPTLDDGEDDAIWLHMLDAMAEQAGSNGAHTLVGEVETSHPSYLKRCAARATRFIVGRSSGGIDRWRRHRAPRA